MSLSRFSPVVSIDEKELFQLRAILPMAFEDGVANANVVAEVLGASLRESEEHFGLNWPGKREARRLSAMPGSGALYLHPKHGVNAAKSHNVFIEGENLEVLKVLQKSYAGRAKLIYIDPPYNTGNDFVYSDNFTEPLEAYLKRIGGVGDQGELLQSNTRADGRFHSTWLSMMYPRLILARKLLREDGAIFVSIDDNEVAHLRQLMNEVFGEENFLGCMVWEGGLKNDARLISSTHDYILAYARRSDSLREEGRRWRIRKEGLEDIYAEVEQLRKRHKNNYAAATQGLREWYRSLPEGSASLAHKHYKCIDNEGVYFEDNISWPGGGGPRYEVLHPITKRPVRIPSRGWVFSTSERMQEEIDAGRVAFGEDETKVPTWKRYLKETEGEVLRSVIYTDRRASTKRLRELMGADVFDYPKDEEVLMKLVEAVATEDEDLVIDFFAGSAATGHACWAQNLADGLHRKFLLVQLPEPVEEGSIASREGYEFISQISRERLRRASQALTHDAPPTQDLGFRAFSLGQSNLKPWDGADLTDLQQIEIAFESAVSPLRDKWDAKSLFYEVLLAEGFPLDADISTIKPGEITLNVVSSPWVNHRLLISFDERVSAVIAKTIELHDHDVFVVLDSALTDASKLILSDRCTLRTI
jgi:adenine-specific DNA-methyltransferase